MRRLSTYAFWVFLILIPGCIFLLHSSKSNPLQTEADLGVIEQHIVGSVDKTGQLPKDLEALSVPQDIRDRSHKADYTYRVISPNSYELCATFPTSRVGGAVIHENGPINDFSHNSKRQCFVGQSLRMLSKERVASGKDPICNSITSNPEIRDNKTVSTDIGTVGAVRDNQLYLTKSPGGANVCQYGVALTPDHKVLDINAIPSGSRVRLSINNSSQILLVQILDKASIPRALERCFAGANEERFAESINYNAQSGEPLVVVAIDLEQRWIKFRDPRGGLSQMYWCESLDVRSKPNTGTILKASELKVGQTVYDPDNR